MAPIHEISIEERHTAEDHDGTLLPVICIAGINLDMSIMEVKNTIAGYIISKEDNNKLNQKLKQILLYSRAIGPLNEYPSAQSLAGIGIDENDFVTFSRPPVEFGDHLKTVHVRNRLGETEESHNFQHVPVNLKLEEFLKKELMPNATSKKHLRLEGHSDLIMWDNKKIETPGLKPRRTLYHNKIKDGSTIIVQYAEQDIKQEAEENVDEEEGEDLEEEDLEEEELEEGGLEEEDIQEEDIQEEDIQEEDIQEEDIQDDPRDGEYEDTNDEEHEDIEDEEYEDIDEETDDEESQDEA